MKKPARLANFRLPLPVRIAARRALALPLALAAGALTVFAFAPYGWWLLQPLTLALMFALLLRKSSPRRSAMIGWAYGFGWMCHGVWWLYISMHVYGELPAWMAALGLVLFALVTAAFAALAMGGAQWLRLRLESGPVTTLLWIFPACWMLGEWLRGWILTGFPWLVSGYAHSASPLAGYAPIVGVYGLSWLAALGAGSIVLWRHKKLPALVMLALLAGGFLLQRVDWTQPSGEPVTVRLLQGNVPQDMKFLPEQTQATLALYLDMMSAAPADLIVTPETALPLLAHQIPAHYLARIREFLRRHDSQLALGIPVRDGPMQYANSVLTLGPDPAQAPYRYDKHHLVPFGEFVPPGARWFVDMMNIPLGDFARRPLLQAPFALRDQWVLPNICYEDLFGEEIARQIAARLAAGDKVPTILLNLSNIAWFGDTIAVPQHLQISQMRALETGRPMLRATNTGATAVIDPKGRIQARLPSYTRATLAATVQGYQGRTPYLSSGNTLPVAAALLALLLPALGFWRRTRQQRGSR